MEFSIDPCKDHLASLVARELTQFAKSSNIEFVFSAADVYALIEKPPESHMGDYSLPCFKFAKTLRLAPPKVAEFLASKLTNIDEWVDSAVVLNAFLNIHIKKIKMMQTLLPLVDDGSFFEFPIAKKNSAGRVMVEYSQPNTHKEFHVGHMRNVCLGSSLVNLYRYCGFDVIAANYLGDEGAHIAKCLWMMKKLGTQPAAGEDKGAWLGKIYAQAVGALESAKDDQRIKFEAEVSAVLNGIESKQGEWYDLWVETRQWSLDAFQTVYNWVDVKFDRDFFESEVSGESQKLVDLYVKKGIFKEDQGAVGVDLNDYKLGFMLVRKRDGNTLYATKDLVLASRKFEEFKIDRNIYVVGNEQNHHFKQVFKTLELMGFRNAVNCFHLSYGMVVLPDGKMSSRAGTSIPFMNLKDTMLTKLVDILSKYKGDWPDAEIERTAKQLCVGSIKYGMLQADPAREIVFNMEDWLSFEGNTGPYLMYGYSRAVSVLEKAKDMGLKPSFIGLKDIEFKQSESDLLRSLYDFNSIVRDSCLQNRPSHLAGHLFYMVKNFSRFYADVPILKAQEKDIIQFRLSLIEGYRKVLQQGLGLLGIDTPNRM